MTTLSGIENFEIMPKNDIDDDDVIKYKKEPCTSNQWSEYRLVANHFIQNDETISKIPMATLSGIENFYIMPKKRY